MSRTDIINQLIKIYGYKTYLEIGVDDPKINFNKISCVKKIGVDPAVKVSGVIQKTSDEFFRTNKLKFDIIFIDGLHHADQVKRDIAHSLECLNDNGSIVVHDCNPTTEEMQQTPRNTSFWTGDVWKAWLYYRNDPKLSMVVLDTDYGVGIIRRGKQQPIGITDETVFTWERLQDYRKDWLNLQPIQFEPVSICIPTYEQNGFGEKVLKELIESIKIQTGKFEIVVSDNSDDHKVYDLCKKHDIRYFHNDKKGISINTNHVIDRANYGFIKPMYQDDKFINRRAIEFIQFALTLDHWIACSGNGIGKYKQGITPRYEDVIDHPKHKNTIGMPSAVAYRKNDIRFDEQLKTMLDSDFYYQLHSRYGLPGIIKFPVVGLRYWDQSASRQQGNLTQEEIHYVAKKHGRILTNCG